ncbi:hypothetical protein BOX15_Mlig022163g7 [Macrostomum lignano]|uniref:Uncharacterized protein n=2 Tax=Macrostomum lignano TaxID=282301 RepID=A0A267G1E1_9PLAT|nr:hypothetical protein BOX15_Mlig022163g7 [Macrostomum lignano]
MSQQQQQNQTESTGSQTITVEPQPQEETVTLHLIDNSTQDSRQVQFAQDTVDNEHLGKKKSKCCCVYKKPRKFDPDNPDKSDSEDEDGHACTMHCQGHTQKSYHKD